MNLATSLVLVSVWALAACSAGDEFETGGAGDGGTGADAGTTGGSGGGSVSGGTSGAGGAASGGVSGSGGTSGAGGGGGGSGGGSGNVSCHWGNDTCPSGTFCNALGCEDGTCMALPAEGRTKNPVCGCDGVTYWNPSVAGHHGMSVKSEGECPAAMACGGFAGIDCPAAASCNLRVDDVLGCGLDDASGTCWVMPESCETGGVGFGPNTRACLSPTCLDECQLVKSGTLWYVDNTCPQ